MVLLSLVVFDELFQFAEEKEEALCVAVKDSCVELHLINNIVK